MIPSKIIPALISVILVCVVAAGLLVADEGQKPDERNNTEKTVIEGNFLERIQAARVFAEKRAVKEEISKQLTEEYKRILAWLKTREGKTDGPFEKDSLEILAVELLSDVRWYGAVDFFTKNIAWHVGIPTDSNEFTPKWQYFPCAMALTKFSGCELKIARAALLSRRDIEMQLLCIVLIEMTNNEDAERILAFSAGDKKELQPGLKATQAFIKSFNRFEWDPNDCEDFDDPVWPKKPMGKPNNDSPAAPTATNTGRLSGTPNSTGTGTSSEGGAESPVAEASPFPWAIVIVVAIAALALGAITTLLLTRAKRR